MTPVAHIPVIVAQHAEDLAMLWHIRRRLARAGHVALRHLARFDERIAAHADGIVVNAAAGLQAVRQQLDPADDARVFATTVSALGLRDAIALEACLDLATALPNVRAGLASAFGWTSAQQLTGVVKVLLSSPAPLRRWLGITACRLHGVDPGRALDAALDDDDADVRAAAWRAAADLSRADIAGRAAKGMTDSSDACRLWAATCALRHRHHDAGRGGGIAMETLLTLSSLAQAVGQLAWVRVALAQPVAAARDWLRPLAADPARARTLIEGVGLVGDPVAVPWLIEQARNDALARAAGASFALITGVDIADVDLDRKPPAEIPDEPNDDPNDEHVALSADDGLPWPDADKLARWWNMNSARFQAGLRHLNGTPVDATACAKLLTDGFQSQRRIAAEHRCLLVRGAPWFNTSAPSWRQTRWLAQQGLTGAVDAASVVAAAGVRAQA